MAEHDKNKDFALDPPRILLREKAERHLEIKNHGPFRWVFPRHHHEHAHIEEVHGEDSWQYRALKFLRSHRVQYTLMILLLLDVIILFTELFLQATFPHCYIIERDAISCCANGEATRQLASDPADICEPPLLVTDNDAGCDGHKWHGVHTLEIVLFSFTLAILTTFLIENIAGMIILTPRVYFRHAGYVLDLFIVSVSLALEITLRAVDQETLSTLAGLLVLARCWRFVRISHGLVEVTGEMEEHKYQELLAYTEELEDELRRHKLPVPDTKAVRALHKRSSGDPLTDAIEQEERAHLKHHFHEEIEALETAAGKEKEQQEEKEH